MEEQREIQESAPVKVGEWILTFILTALPIAGLVLLFVWAFGGRAKPSKKNWARAILLLMVIMLVIYCLFFAAIGAALHSLI